MFCARRGPASSAKSSHRFFSRASHTMHNSHTTSLLQCHQTSSRSLEIGMRSLCSPCQEMLLTLLTFCGTLDKHNRNDPSISNLFDLSEYSCYIVLFLFRRQARQSVIVRCCAIWRVPICMHVSSVCKRNVLRLLIEFHAIEDMICICIQN